jgi:Bacterial Ig domain
MKRILFLCALVIALTPGRTSAQITVTLGGPGTVASANDFATSVLQDPWDMNERTDVGWWLNSVDMPFPGFSSATFVGGMFSGTVSADPNLWLLESGSPNLPAIGKNGNTYAINADLYQTVAVRMRLDEPGYMLFLWSTHTMYESPGLQTSGPVYTTPGWRIYFVDLASLGLLAGTEGWNGTKRSLRLDPAPDNATPNSHIDIDWIRLVDNQPAHSRTVSWTNAGGNVDIYLDNDNDPNQTLGLVAQNVSGSTYQLNAGALPPGTYYVAIRRTGTNNAFTYSTTTYQVNAPATINVTAPSDEGSADDFATGYLNNAWDMTSASDVDTVLNVTNAGVATIPGAETEAGATLGDITAYYGISSTGVFNPGACASFAKPVVYPLDPGKRGTSARIDPNKYRIFTMELGLPNKPRDLCGGSIVRVGWQVAGQEWTSSWGIPLNSRAGANVVNRINFDMAAIPIDAGGASQAGWVPGSSAFPGISGFRIDPHEFASPTGFFIKRVKLAALEKANASYTIRWTSSKAGGTVHVYYDTDKDPTVKTLIGSTTASSTTGSLLWNTTTLPQGGQYYVYVEFDDGLNTNGAYSKWPVVIDHNPVATARIVLNRTQLNFGIRGLTVKTPAQVVRLTALDAAAGQPCWNVTSELWFLQVTPSSGCGSASLTVSLLDQNYPWTGDYFGSIRVTSSGAINSPQGIQTTVRMNPTSAPPSGAVDTPANGAVVSGSVAVTGWATDDIGVARVTICREPIQGEGVPANPACGPNQIYVGDAVSIEDARPDIEAYSPTTPLNYRAGWGFLVLTNMLPNQGTGTFVLHMRAFDVDGQQAELGWRYIFAQNSTATEPFGAIDTPGQGETIAGSAYANFGWVLSRVRRADPPGGGTVVVYVDGVAVGSPGGWNARSDLSALFPGYPGIGTALGVFGLNTLAYSNGLHTIVWVVTDNGGVTSGVGSRYFTVFNSGALTMASGAGAMRPPGADLGRRIDQLPTIAAGGSIVAREGFRAGTRSQSVGAGINGVHRLWATERDRVEIRLADSVQADGATYEGYLLVNGRLSELPVGSSFDPARGAFYWQPGLGYLGDFDLMFVRTRADRVRERIPVRVTLQPRPAGGVARASDARSPWTGIDFLR